MILSLDKIMRLIFSYAKAHLKSSASAANASRETAVLDGLKEEAQRFQQEFEAGSVPLCTAAQPATGTAGNIAPRLLEAENTLQDLAGEDAGSENPPQKAAARRKPTLFARTPLAIRGTYNSLLRSRWRECSVTCSTPRAITTGFTRYFTRL